MPNMDYVYELRAKVERINKLLAFSDSLKTLKREAHSFATYDSAEEEICVDQEVLDKAFNYGLKQLESEVEEELEKLTSHNGFTT